MNKIFENYFKQNLKENYDEEDQKRLASAMARVRKTGDTDREAVVDIQDVEEQDLQQLKDKYLKDKMFRKAVDNRLSNFITGVDKIVTIDPEMDFMKDLKSNYTQQVRGINEESISYSPPGPIMKKSGYSAGGDRPEVVSIPGTDFPHVNIGQGKFIYKWDDDDIDNWVDAVGDNQKQNVLKRIEEKASAAHKVYIKGLDEFSGAFGNKNADTNVAQAEEDFPAGLPMPPQVALIKQRYSKFAQIQNNQAEYKKKLQFIASVRPASYWDQQNAIAADEERFIAQQKSSAQKAAAAASKDIQLNKVSAGIREDFENTPFGQIVADEVNKVVNNLPEIKLASSILSEQETQELGREVAVSVLNQVRNKMVEDLPGMVEEILQNVLAEMDS